MAWVREAVKKTETQGLEILHQTVHGDYGTKTSIFWAIDPVDVPVTLRENVEETIQDDAVGESKCAIVRLETLPAYNIEELEVNGNPIAYFKVFIGSDVSHVEYDRRINIYGNRKSSFPSDEELATHWGPIEGNAISKRLRKMSMTMGWTEPPPLTHSPTSSFSDGGSPTSPIRAPTADRRLSLAVPDFPYRTEAAAKRFSRKFSLRPGWMDSSQSSPTDTHNSHDEVISATLASLEGHHPTPSNTNTTKGQTTIGQRHSIAGPSEATLNNIRRMSTVRRVSCYAPDPIVNRLVDMTYNPQNTARSGPSFSQHPNTIFNTNVDYNKERPLPTVEIHLSGEPDPTGMAPGSRINRMSHHRKQSLLTANIPEIEEEPINKFRHRQSQVDPKALSNAFAVEQGTAAPCKEQPLSGSAKVTFQSLQKKSARRTSQFVENNLNVPEIRETPKINFQSFPSQPDPKALNDALAALEGAHGPQPESPVSEKFQVTPQKLKTTSSKRVSLFLDTPEVVETAAPVLVGKPPIVPAKSKHRRKASVEYALAALESPTPPEANMGRPRRPDPATKSRKTKSLYLELTTPTRDTFQFPGTHSALDTGHPETKFESTSRKLKRMSWDVIGRALPQPKSFVDLSSYSTLRESPTASNIAGESTEKAKRLSRLPTVRTIPVSEISPTFGTANNFSWDRRTSVNVPHERRIEPLPRKHNRFSMDPAVAEIQCGPRKEFGAPAPWLEPTVQQPMQSTGPAASNSTTKSKRASWLPMAARDIQPDVPSTLDEISPPTCDFGGKERVEDAKMRKKTNRMSRLLFSQGPKKRYTQEVFPQLSGPLNSHPAASSDHEHSRIESPARAPQRSRLKKFGLQLGRFFR